MQKKANKTHKNRCKSFITNGGSRARMLTQYLLLQNQQNHIAIVYEIVIWKIYNNWTFCERTTRREGSTEHKIHSFEGSFHENNILWDVLLLLFNGKKHTPKKSDVSNCCLSFTSRYRTNVYKYIYFLIECGIVQDPLANDRSDLLSFDRSLFSVQQL